MVSVLVFGFALWLGLYLLARDAQKGVVRYTGLGLVVYALGLALDLLGSYGVHPALVTLRWPLLFIPALCWFAAAVYLLPEVNPLRAMIAQFIPYGLFVAVAALFVVSLLLGIVPPVVHTISAFIAVGLALAAALLVWRNGRLNQPRRPRALLLTFALFFSLSSGLLIVPAAWFPRDVTLFLLGLDLVWLGIAVGILDAFDEGEAFTLDFLRSLSISALAAAIFGGQVALVMFASRVVSFPMLVLLLAVIATAVAAQVFADSIQKLLDRLVFNRFPHIRQARADLRAAASALPRMNEALELDGLDEAEFIRLTRRALSHLGNLDRLAASPLTRLPLIEQRLSQRGETDNTLERAAELKAVLTESIARLKPRGKGDFGASDEWRYYNALYFPYVVGLKPYSRNGALDDLDAAARAALDWFQATVPERTLHNWQNAAAKLIAHDLRERDGRG
jgi:hypothetical protein